MDWLFFFSTLKRYSLGFCNVVEISSDINEYLQLSILQSVYKPDRFYGKPRHRVRIKKPSGIFLFRWGYTKGFVDYCGAHIARRAHPGFAIRPSSVGSHRFGVLLDAGELLSSLPTSLAVLANQVSGISYQSGTANTQRFIIRGIGSRTPYGSNRIKAYFGPIPLSAADGSTSFEDIDVSAIGRIEVVKGPSSAIYGAGLGGAIVLVPELPSQTGQSVSVRSLWGDFGLHKLGATASMHNQNHQFSLAFNHTDWDGYRANNHLDQQNITGIWQHNTDKSAITAIVVANAMQAGIPSSLNLEQYKQDPAQAAPNWLSAKGFEKKQSLLGGVSNNLAINPKLKNTVTIYGSVRNGYEHRPFNVLDDESFQIGAKDQLSWLGPNGTINISAEHYSDKYYAIYFETLSAQKGTRINQLSQWRYQTNLAAWLLLSPMGKLHASLGVNLNMASYRFKDEFDDEANTNGHIAYQPIISPRAGIDYHPAKQWNLYASAGQGFSHPTAEEALMADGTPNPRLNPETGWTAEMGVRFGTLDQRFWMEITSYRIWLRNLLVTKRLDEATFYGINAGKTDHWGIETNGNYIFPMLYRGQLKMVWSFWSSINKFKRFVDDDADYTGNHLPGIPGFTAYIGLNANMGNSWKLVVDVSGWGKQWFNDANSVHANQWITANTKVCKQVGLKRMSITLHLGVQNIFDQKYASMILVNAPSFSGSLPRYYYPAMPRYASGGLMVSLR
ncbi:MAG: TonB-dependent receptor [Breznakibacter sp.]